MRHKIESYRKKGAVIGENVRLWGTIDGVNPHLVTIGDNVCLAEKSHIITHCPVSPGGVTIGKDSWIGYGSIILPNVIIGEGALIGAGSVVTKDIPQYVIACGDPAVVVKGRDMKELNRTVYLIKNDLPVGEVKR